jgi:hypothetical protein
LVATSFLELACFGQSTNAPSPAPTVATNQVFARRQARLVFPKGAIVPVGTPFRVVAEVEPDAKKVSFFVNGVAIGTATNAPFEVTWASDKPGHYNVSAIIAYGSTGPRLAAASASQPSAAPFSMRIDGAETGLYVIEATADLKQWEAISTNRVADSIIQFADPDAPRHKQRFYRVRKL